MSVRSQVVPFSSQVGTSLAEVAPPTRMGEDVSSVPAWDRSGSFANSFPENLLLWHHPDHLIILFSSCDIYFLNTYSLIKPEVTNLGLFLLSYRCFLVCKAWTLSFDMSLTVLGDADGVRWDFSAAPWAYVGEAEALTRRSTWWSWSWGPAEFTCSDDVFPVPSWVVMRPAGVPAALRQRVGQRGHRIDESAAAAWLVPDRWPE